MANTVPKILQAVGQSLTSKKIRRLKSALNFLRHQLRAKAHSMNNFGCFINYGLRFVAWLSFG